MTTPINLNKARKARARAEARRAADANAAFHGLTKAQKRVARAEAERAARQHDGQRRARSDADGTGGGEGEA